MSECETANHILEAQMAFLRHPKVVIGLACGVALFLLLGLLRCCWHVRVGAVPGAFPFDLLPGWVLRRIWRVVRWPFVQASSRLFGPQVAEGVAGVMDEMAVSPEAPVYATIRHPPSVPTFRGVPAGAVLGVQRADTSAADGTAPTPPPPPPSVATVYYSAASKPLPPLPEGSLRSQASSPTTPARKRLDFESSNLARSTTVIDVSSLIYFFFFVEIVLTCKIFSRIFAKLSFEVTKNNLSRNLYSLKKNFYLKYSNVFCKYKKKICTFFLYVKFLISPKFTSSVIVNLNSLRNIFIYYIPMQLSAVTPEEEPEPPMEETPFRPVGRFGVRPSTSTPAVYPRQLSFLDELAQKQREMGRSVDRPANFGC